MSMPAVRVFSGSDLTICFGLASRDYTHVVSAFYALYFFKTFSVYGLRFRFRAAMLCRMEMPYQAKNYVTNFVRAAH